MRRTETWLALAALAVAVVVTGVLGLFAYMTATAPLHPEPQDVPSVARAAAASEWAEAAEAGRQIVHAALVEQNLPGLSVAVAAGGDIVWAEGFGWADLEARVPVTPETRFRIGTTSTVLTSAAIGVLVEEGRLRLDDEIQTYVPRFPEKEWPVTVRQLMAHVGGVRDDGGDEGPLFSVRCERPVEALEHVAAGPLLFEPGTEHRPSSYGWILLSAAVEAAAGEPFFTFVRERVFEPLGLRDTMGETGTEPIPNRATSYFPRFAADPRYGQHLLRDVEYSCYAGASAFLSTPSDLVRFVAAIESGTLLKPATVRALQTSERLITGEDTGDGLGWDLETVTLLGKSTRVAGGSGEILGGTVSSLLSLPEHGLVVSVISNISYADTFAVGLKVAEAFARTKSEPAPGGERD